MEKRRKRGTVGLILKIVMILVLLLITVLGFLFYKKYGKRILLMEAEAKKIVAESNHDTFKQTETSLLYDTNGIILSRLKGEKDVYYIKYADIPKDAVEAIVSIEDKKFFRHKGYDLLAIGRAGLAYIKNKGVITQGGSTITQQLARNIFLSFEESWQRKAKEIFIAKELEKKYTKKEIMEFYLNNIYFANGYYGIQSASYGYFGKSVNSLSLSQIAFLLSIPNSPNRYDPYENIEGTLGRRDRIIKQMEKDGKLSSEKAAKAIAEKIKVRKRKRSKSGYVETFALDQAIKALMKRDGFVFRNSFPNKEIKESYQEEYAKAYALYQRNLYSGGYRIYTSIDPKKQEVLQKTVDEHLKSSKEKSDAGVYLLQGAAVTIDNDTGRVVAIVGGRSQNFAGSTLNRAYQSHRQPGSTIKPLIVYTPAFEQDYRPENIVRDERIEKGPENADGVFSGVMTMLDAVARSKNTIPWRLFTELSPAKGIGKLLDMNFSTIEEEDYYPAASLGGMSKGVSALELTSAYAAIENKGIFREPTCIIKITDAEGNDQIPNGFDENPAGTSVYEEEATKMMITCLQAVMKKGTGIRGQLAKIPSAGKTGTTNDTKDLWFAGFTKYYTTGIWVGYDLPRSLKNLPFETNPLSMWKEYMEIIHEGLPILEFEAYEMPKRIEKKKEEEKKETEENLTEPEILEEDPEIEEEDPELIEEEEEPEEQEPPEETLPVEPEIEENEATPEATPETIPETVPEVVPEVTPETETP